MRVHPYLFAGLGRKPWVTYSICDGYAHIERSFGGPTAMPLARASIQCENSLTTRFGFGHITIVAESGAVQEWRKVPRVQTVYNALLRVSRGLPTDAPEANTVLESGAKERAIRSGVEMVAGISAWAVIFFVIGGGTMLVKWLAGGAFTVPDVMGWVREHSGIAIGVGIAFAAVWGLFALSIQIFGYRAAATAGGFYSDRELLKRWRAEKHMWTSPEAVEAMWRSARREGTSNEALLERFTRALIANDFNEIERGNILAPFVAEMGVAVSSAVAPSDITEGESVLKKVGRFRPGTVKASDPETGRAANEHIQ